MATAQASPNKPRPSNSITRLIADGLASIERNYAREGSGPGSRFEGMLLEDAQAEWVMRTIDRAFQKFFERGPADGMGGD